MSKFVAVGPKQHQSHAWISPNDLGFCKDWPSVPLTIAEIAHVMPIIPIAFTKHMVNGSSRYNPVALLSPVNGRNLYLRPDNQWVAGYVPAFIRMHPFRSLLPTGKSEPVLCIDESALTKDLNAEGAGQMFDNEGQPSKALQKVIDVAGEFQKHRAQTQHAVDLLESMNLIVPWQLKLPGVQGSSGDGIFHIDYKALLDLSGENLETLNKAGALQLAYGQMLSEQRSQQFPRLLSVQNEAQKRLDQAQEAHTTDIESFFSNKDDTIKF